MQRTIPSGEENSLKAHPCRRTQEAEETSLLRRQTDSSVRGFKSPRRRHHYFGGYIMLIGILIVIFIIIVVVVVIVSNLSDTFPFKRMNGKEMDDCYSENKNFQRSKTQKK